MQLSKAFVVTMGLVMVFLLTAFATEQGRCIARARRLLGDQFPVMPAGRMAAAESSQSRVFLTADSVRLVAACEAPKPKVNVRAQSLGSRGPLYQTSLVAGLFGDSKTRRTEPPT
jgi:hypothetical protein